MESERKNIIIFFPLQKFPILCVERRERIYPFEWLVAGEKYNSIPKESGLWIRLGLSGSDLRENPTFEKKQNRIRILPNLQLILSAFFLFHLDLKVNITVISILYYHSGQ